MQFTAIAGPVMMMLAALTTRGPVSALLKVGADSPDTARKPNTLGLKDPPLQPLLRSGVLVKEADGRVWVDRVKAKKRQWRLARRIGAIGLVLGGLVFVVLKWL